MHNHLMVHLNPTDLQEWELFRVWDSCELVNTEEDETEHHLQHNAGLSADQTKAIMFLSSILIRSQSPVSICIYIRSYFDHTSFLFQIRPDLLARPPTSAILAPCASAPGPRQRALPAPKAAAVAAGLGEKGDGLPDQPAAEKAKKPVSLTRKFASKVSMLSSKITETKCMVTQLASSNLLLASHCVASTCYEKYVMRQLLCFFWFNHPRSDGMKAAYQQEITRVQTDLEQCKMNMESWYALRIPDAEIVGDQRERYDESMNEADKHIGDFMGTMKTIRNAIVAWHISILKQCIQKRIHAKLLKKQINFVIPGTP